MKLKFINPATLDRNLKATIHKSGKLGFTVQAATKMELVEYKSAKIALNDEDALDTSLYVKILDTVEDDAFKINKAGDYYYLNTKALFDEMDLDYSTQSIAYDIATIEIGGEQYFKFKRRPPKKTKRPIQKDGS
jgi:hypothetical protein